jgi:8-oxo-dGTP pyrophosphatase MutT (NUDIX family)
MADPERPVSVPRKAATVLIVRDHPFEVLMVKRHEKAYYASALVFPGGVVETDDAGEAWLPHLCGSKGLDIEERSFRIAACREIFEESALLITVPAISLPALEADRSEISFLQIIRDHGLKLNLDALVNFAHWLTPELAPKRFDTRFYICKAPGGHRAICDGVETVSLAWMSPKAVLKSFAAGEISIAFPTRMNLMRLAESSDSESALAASRVRPHFKVIPQLVQTETGHSVRIPLEAGYGITGDDLPPI